MISLTHEEYDILLDEFLLRDDIKMMVPKFSTSNHLVRLRHCFDMAHKGSLRDRIMNGSSEEQKAIHIAHAMLIGYQLGKDIKSGVSQRGMAAND